MYSFVKILILPFVFSLYFVTLACSGIRLVKTLRQVVRGQTPLLWRQYAEHTHISFILFNRPIFLKLLQVRPVPISKLLGIDVAVLRILFLSPSQQRQSTDATEGNIF